MQLEACLRVVSGSLDIMETARSGCSMSSRMGPRKIARFVDLDLPYWLCVFRKVT